MRQDQESPIGARNLKRERCWHCHEWVEPRQGLFVQKGTKFHVEHVSCENEDGTFLEVKRLQHTGLTSAEVAKKMCLTLKEVNAMFIDNPIGI